MTSREVANHAILTGETEEHLMSFPEGCSIHRMVLDPLRDLQQAARSEGFELAIASGFRSFSRQLIIWNEKAAGRRPVLDDGGRPIDLSELDDWGKVQAILRWSALPGASRHHWGTDLDVFDRNALSADCAGPQLTLAECEPGGLFADFHHWLDGALRHPDCGFYRPYAEDLGGVGREPWHISYRPLAISYQQALDPAVLASAIAAADMALRDTVLAHLNEIHERYVAVPV